MTIIPRKDKTNPKDHGLVTLFSLVLSFGLMPQASALAQTEDPATQIAEWASYQGEDQINENAEAEELVTLEKPLGDDDVLAGMAAAQEEAAEETTAPVVAPPQTPSQRYGWWVLIPAGAAILLAILTRQVVPSLVIGVLVGAYMMFPCLPPDSALAGANSLLGGFRLATEQYIMGEIHDPEFGFGHLKILIFTLVIGFMVGVIGRNGGTAGLVCAVTGKTESPRRGALTAWLAGLFVFFDDYANTMIVGPTMRSVFDKVKLSRAKLAYIVDSTAAPVASLALIGTWVGAEIGFIQTGLDAVEQMGAPAFLLNEQGAIAVDGMGAFMSSIAYRFYPILALFLVFLIALTRRDFGPMKKSEARALTAAEAAQETEKTEEPKTDQPRPCWWLGLFPVLALIATTVTVLIVTGLSSPDTIAARAQGEIWSAKPWYERAGTVISNADSYQSIFYGAILSAIFAVVLTIAAGACRVKAAIDAGLAGMARMFPAIVILILAWALSAVSMDLELNLVIKEKLEAMQFPVVWLPLAVFIAAAVVSFATGTSWGTMGILCPLTVTTAATLASSDSGLTPEQALALFYASVGSVLAGAVFGDHCSPISDTTVLSSIAADCPHEEHVWTQVPYALLAAVAAMGLGDVLCSVYHQPWYYGIGAGALFLIIVVAVVGRRATPDIPPPRPLPPGTIERRLAGEQSQVGDFGQMPPGSVPP